MIKLAFLSNNTLPVIIQKKAENNQYFGIRIDGVPERFLLRNSSVREKWVQKLTHLS